MYRLILFPDCSWPGWYKGAAFILNIFENSHLRFWWCFWTGLLKWWMFGMVFLAFTSEVESDLMNTKLINLIWFLFLPLQGSWRSEEPWHRRWWWEAWRSRRSSACHSWQSTGGRRWASVLIGSSHQRGMFSFYKDAFLPAGQVWSGLWNVLTWF